VWHQFKLIPVNGVPSVLLLLISLFLKDETAPPPVWNTPFPLPWMTEFPNVTMAPVPLARTPVLLNSETRWSMKTPIPGFPAGTVAVTPALLF
jgi:hypothetical protein